MQLKVTVTWEDDDGIEQSVDLPGKHQVCGNCDGHGTHLREGMREHAYTSEEFEDAFHDEEDRGLGGLLGDLHHRERKHRANGGLDCILRPARGDGLANQIGEERSPASA